MFWIITILLFLLEAASCQAGTLESGVIRGLRIQGTERPIRLETQVGDRLDRESVARDVRRLWATGWFDDIRVDLSEESDGVSLVFHLAERPRYYLRRIEFEPSGERRPIEIEPGTPIDRKLAHQTAVGLQNQLNQEGYSDAEVQGEIVPVGLHEADLHLRLKRGQRFRIGEIRLSGALGLSPDELRRGLRFTKDRRILPALPALWEGWRWQPPFSHQRVEADLESLRSFYLSHGYWDATVRLAGIDFAEEKATVSIEVRSGPRYNISQTHVLRDTPGRELFLSFNGDSPAQELCHCLRQEQRRAEKEGRLDFAAHLEVQSAERSHEKGLTDENGQSQGREGPIQVQWVSLTAKLETSPPYRVRRIEFRGNHSYSDLTLRRILLLNEGEPFDHGLLRQSLARLNRLGFFRTLTEDHVQIARDPATRQVDLTLDLRETRPGRWALSGSLDPLSLFRPLQFSMGSRLPSWGSGPLELSTYFASLSLSPFSQPLGSLLFLRSGMPWRPLVSIGRPYLPGQGWQSGFVMLPQQGGQATLLNSGMIQARRGLLALEGGQIETPQLAVSVWRLNKPNDEYPASPRFAGSLLCDSPTPRSVWVRSAALAALDWALKSSIFLGRAS